MHTVEARADRIHLTAHIQQSDPDVIIGHELVGVSLDVLLHRMRDLKVDHFSKIGRLRRPTWPQLSAKWNVPLLAGRLICDLASDCGKVSGSGPV